MSDELNKLHDQKAEEFKEKLKDNSSAAVSERVFFEDDEEIRLRDGKAYKIPPCTIKNARILMKKLGSINIDAVLLNFIPTGDEQADAQREADFFDIMKIAFINYPEIDKEYLEEYLDLETAREIIEILIGLNGLKK